MLVKQLIVSAALFASVLLGTGIISPDSCWIRGSEVKPTSNLVKPNSCWIRG